MCQNPLSALAVVSGASTAGECAAAGMQTAFGVQPGRRLLLRGRLPLVVVFPVQHEHRHVGQFG